MKGFSTVGFIIAIVAIAGAGLSYFFLIKPQQSEQIEKPEEAIKETAEEVEKITEETTPQVICSYGNINLKSVSYSNGVSSGQIKNIGQIKLEGLSLSIIYKNAGSEQVNLNRDLEVAETYLFNVNIAENFDSIRVVTSNCPNVFDEVTSVSVSAS